MTPSRTIDLEPAAGRDSPDYSRRARPAFGPAHAGSIIIREMRPLILALLVCGRIRRSQPAPGSPGPAGNTRGTQCRRNGLDGSGSGVLLHSRPPPRRRRQAGRGNRRPQTGHRAGPGIRGASGRARRALRPQRPRERGARNRAGRPREGSGQPGGQQDPRYDLRRPVGPATAAPAGRQPCGLSQPRHHRAREGAARGAFDINIDLMLGRLYAQTGAYEKALPLLRHVVDDQPGYQEGALLLAATEESAGRPATRSRRWSRRSASIRISTADSFAWQKPTSERDAGPMPRTLSGGPRPSTRGTRRSSPRRAVALINAGKAAEARGILEPVVSGIRHAGCRDDVPPRRGAAGRSRSRRPPRARRASSWQRTRTTSVAFTCCPLSSRSAAT